MGNLQTKVGKPLRMPAKQKATRRVVPRVALLNDVILRPAPTAQGHHSTQCQEAHRSGFGDYHELAADFSTSDE